MPAPQPSRASLSVSPVLSVPAQLIIGLLTALLSLGAQADSWPQQEVSPEEAGFTAEGLEQLDQAMREAVANQDVAGMVWLLAKDGKVATYEHAGLARLNDQAPMTRDSLFRIYSMTKPVTGVALMMLWEEGLWDFDDPVSKFIPEFADLTVMTDTTADGRPVVEPVKRQPTMRELLNHTAGFGYGLSGDDPVNTAFRDKAVLASDDLDQLVDKVADIPLLYHPGERWIYSIAVDLQGYIVQQISGMKFGDFLHERIFAPLDMMDTAFYVRPDDHDRFAEVHYWDREAEGLAQQPHRADRPSYLDANRLESGGGGLVSSTHDYARFAQMLINEGELEGTRILKPESVRIMRTNSLTGEEDLSGAIGGVGQPGIGFGVDFAVLEDPGLIGTAQGAGTYRWGGAAGTTFWVDPVNNILWLSMIQAQGPRRPGAANFNGQATDLIYQHLEK